MSKQNYFFSVIIPAYNVGRYIRNTIQSVLNQTYSDFEIIVIDDGSTDDTAEIVSSICDKRIKLISKTNGGVSSARNLGIELSKGKYLAWLDGDDIWNSHYLETAYRALREHPSINWYAARYISTNEVDDRTIKEPIHPKISIISYYSRKPGFVCSSSNIMKRTALPNSKLFPEGMKYAEDGCAWAYFASKNELLIFNDSISAYYIMRNQSAMHNINAELELEYLKQELSFFKKLIITPNQSCISRLYQLHYICIKSLKYKALVSRSRLLELVLRVVTAIFYKIILRTK